MIFFLVTTMPPKRKLVVDSMNLSRSQRKRKAPNASDSATNSVDFHSFDSSDNTLRADVSPSIDYDKLTAAILKHTSHKPPTATEAAVTPATQLQRPTLPTD